MEVKNRLLNFSNKIIYQNTDWFSFSLDSVLLANFVTIKLSDKKILDLASGNAPIPMLLTYRTKAKIIGVELQKEISELAIRSINENNMQDQITMYNEDINDLGKILPLEQYDVIVTNPPYFKQCNINNDPIKTIARHEMKINLEQLISTSTKLLKNKGTFAMVHRPERLIEIITIMKQNNIEPKKIRFVYPKQNRDSNILLIEGIKNGNIGLKVLNPLFVYDENGNYCEEINKMFGE